MLRKALMDEVDGVLTLNQRVEQKRVVPSKEGRKETFVSLMKGNPEKI